MDVFGLVFANIVGAKCPPRTVKPEISQEENHQINILNYIFKEQFTQKWKILKLFLSWKTKGAMKTDNYNE
jgi:hypothetical protein